MMNGEAEKVAHSWPRSESVSIPDPCSEQQVRPAARWMTTEHAVQESPIPCRSSNAPPKAHWRACAPGCPAHSAARIAKVIRKTMPPATMVLRWRSPIKRAVHAVHPAAAYTLNPKP